MYTIACARFRAQTKIGCSKLQAPAGGNSRRRLLTRFARHLGDCALIPHELIRSVLDSHVHLFGVYLNFHVNLFKDVFDSNVHLFGAEPDSHVYLFKDGTTRRSAKLAQRAFAPALASRGAPGVPAESIFGGVKMRPRKLDGY